MSITHKSPFDVRVVEYHLRKGTISHEEYEQYLTALADDETESEETETQFVPSYENRHYGEASDADEGGDALEA